MEKKPVEQLIKIYYKEIFHYCYNRLNGDFHTAEDCTQEVMFILHKKVNSLDMSEDIRPWLYSVADKEIKACQRKKVDTVDIEDVSEQLSENPFESSILDILTDDERQLINAYASGADKLELAKKEHLTLDALYKRISRMKEKISESLCKTNRKKKK